MWSWNGSPPCLGQWARPMTDAGHADDLAIPSIFDTSVPNVARIYDYLLGGKDNFVADREAANALVETFPSSRIICLDNRAFLQRVVRSLAGLGIRQFMDIGSGLPTAQNTHQVVHEIAPGARVVYVDYDPIVISHAKALLADNQDVGAIQRDLCRPTEIIEDEELRKFLDFREPVAVLMAAVAHFVSDDQHPYEIAGTLKEAMAPGSYLALTHVTSDHVSHEVRQSALDVYKGASAQLTPRTRTEVTRFFDGLELMEPGIVDIRLWHPEIWPSMPLDGSRPTSLYGGVGVKRLTTWLRRAPDAAVSTSASAG
jgi:hypothetical protein